MQAVPEVVHHVVELFGYMFSMFLQLEHSPGVNGNRHAKTLLQKRAKKHRYISTLHIKKIYKTYRKFNGNEGKLLGIAFQQFAASSLIPSSPHVKITNEHRARDWEQGWAAIRCSTGGFGGGGGEVGQP